MNLETLTVLVKVVENVLNIVMREYPEIVTRAILETQRDNKK